MDKKNKEIEKDNQMPKIGVIANENYEDVCDGNGEFFCKAKDLITISIEDINPNDNRIQILMTGFLKKAEELGFKTATDYDFCMCGLDSIDIEKSRTRKLALASY